MSIAKEYESITMKSENIVSALKETAQSTIPPKSSNCTHEIWKNDDVLNEYLEVRANLQRSTPRYNEVSKQIKKRVRYLRNQKLQMEAEELNRFASKRQIENLFRNFKEDNHAFKSSNNTKVNAIQLNSKSTFATILKAHVRSQNQKN